MSTDPAPLISGEAVAAIVTAIVGVGTGLVTFLRWAVNSWLAERRQERAEVLADRKEEREERAKDRSVLSDMQLEVRSLFIQSQRRDERRRQSEAPQMRRGPRDDFEPTETTGVVEIYQEQLRGRSGRMPTPATGIRRPNTKAEDR